jgi:dihydrofolate reductase
MTEIALIVAMDHQRAIGRAGSLPWHLPEDLKRFRALTQGDCVLMGRKTWLSIGRPLPKRRNLVLSADPQFVAPGAEVFRDLSLALAACEFAPRLWVIGGGVIYQHCLALAQRLEITWVEQAVEGADTFFPALNAAEFAIEAVGSAPGCRFETWLRRCD